MVELFVHSEKKANPIDLPLIIVKVVVELLFIYHGQHQCRNRKQLKRERETTRALVIYRGSIDYYV